MNTEKLIVDLVDVLSTFRDWELQFVNVKSQNDFVTSADMKLQERLTDVLTRHKNIPVLAEESTQSTFSFCDEFWVVDPLDGTSNFINRIPFTSSSIALVSRGEVVFGFVFDFNDGSFYHAQASLGSFKGSTQLRAKPSGGDAPLLIGCSTGFLKHLSRSKISLEDYIYFSNSNFRVLGSQALQLCYVAEGKLAANFSTEAKIWDDIAASLIVAESGCLYSSLTLETKSIVDCFISGSEMRSIASCKWFDGPEIGRFMKEII